MKHLDATDVLPGIDEELSVHCRRQISVCFDTLDQNRTLNNEKVGEMAVAHRAMTNFIWGLFLVAVAGCFMLWLHAPETNVVEQLKTNQNLRELLRGPRGEPGPAGICQVPPPLAGTEKKRSQYGYSPPPQSHNPDPLR